MEAGIVGCALKEIAGFLERGVGQGAYLGSGA
jgi:hypothetical protein